MKNVVLVSGVQQSDAGIHKRVFFQILSLLDYYRILSRVLVLYSGSLLAIHFKYRNIYISILKYLNIPAPSASLVIKSSSSKWNESVSVS